MPADLHFGSLTGSCLAKYLIEIRLTLLREETVHGGTGIPISINNQDTLLQIQIQDNIILTIPQVRFLLSR